ncbi:MULTISPECIES: phosphoenolpyruvate--protein phosphotransferase [unclassified Sporosarcina]|uniref:phosphoenolpyruvate--protein phosphotransferase n=1 Tax=unclassified Sporosarcina TaxID=2647733 RepID=UPI000C16F8C4|nr:MULTISPECIES: phosphoenolpyruvate--protein phosphotransferase [unclassified Sporosarcina]PID07052.1 phosphoenolpyruvate--protein phosphotransferase [Sporosarcina sp. P30]PID10248.1 phosphoenolpyruvate--protein phosphotransferase [Sporosarcina sp. P31]PID12146.1 phosphoenolpyruvate--protein phosphotransferase [Sporosarcina sp. P32b]
MNKILQGIAASNGISIAKAFRLENAELTVLKESISDVSTEIDRLQNALSLSRSELTTIQKQTQEKFSDQEAAIFSAHVLVLDDPELRAAITDTIQTQHVNAEYAVQEAANLYVSIFEAMDDPYMRERAADIRDVTKRILSHLLGVSIQTPEDITQEVVIIAEDLTPSHTVQLNPELIKGFVTDIGGPTSHSAILARTLEIPAVVGSKTAMAMIQNGEIIIVDGEAGKVIVNPDAETLAVYQEKQQAFAKQKAEWQLLANEPAITLDGHRVELAGNIGTPDDVENVLKNGGEAIGLFRTEFLYMGKEQFPTEDEQFEAYKSVLEQMNGSATIVRTLDIGGDKELPYLQLPHEANPFLGLRAIRLCLDHEEMFRTQLRALLRASIYGNLRIMFPMIATINEFRQAKELFLDVKQQLISERIEVSETIQLGIMVETPAVAILADVFAKEVDFFSIGSNDLIQYTMAADRMNEHVSYLYQPYNPSILRFIKMIIDAAHKEGKMVGMCGEMARDETAIPILLGMGLDEFSMSASSILRTRSQIQKLSKVTLENQIDHILSLSTADEVLHFIKSLDS